MTNQLLEGALGLTARGIPTIALRPRSKVPLHRDWPRLGMLDPESIRVEWRLNPSSNVGVLCGADAFDGRGLVVVDVDLPDGPEALRRLELEHGNLPATATVRTPRGGRHFYYTGHAVSWDPTPGLEIRSTGRQCAAPPSLLADGSYRWLADGQPVELPAWLAAPPSPAAHGQPAPGAVGRGGFVSAVNDPVLEVAPRTYFRVLCGLAPDRGGFVSCPVHPFPDVEPSCKVYDSPRRGWFCFGSACRKGGDVISLAAHLAGIDLPVRGYAFELLLDYLRGRLL